MVWCNFIDILKRNGYRVLFDFRCVQVLFHDWISAAGILSVDTDKCKLVEVPKCDDNDAGKSEFASTHASQGSSVASEDSNMKIRMHKATVS